MNLYTELLINFSIFSLLNFYFMSKMNHSRSHHDRHKACDAVMNEPVYENAGVSFADLQNTKCLIFSKNAVNPL